MLWEVIQCGTCMSGTHATYAGLSSAACKYMPHLDDQHARRDPLTCRYHSGSSWLVPPALPS